MNASAAERMQTTGRWNQIKGKAKELWGDLTDDDLDVAEGNMQQLVGRIQERTGDATEDIQKRLEQESGEAA